jgi:hypothetical protein
VSAPRRFGQRAPAGAGAEPPAITVTNHQRTRHWAVRDSAGELVCLTVYRKGGEEVKRRLQEQEERPMSDTRTGSPAFIGYGRFAEWLDWVDRDMPVLAIPLVEPGTEHSGLRTDRLLVVCQQVGPEGHVHYCRLRAAEMTRCGGEPFDRDWQEREAAWHSLWEAVEQELLARGLTARRATVAPPRWLRLLEGDPHPVAFDRETKRYRRPN